MEEKIYERSVTKQATSCRVIDEQQVDRHYNLGELSELYRFNPLPSGPRPVPNLPSDPVLASVLAKDLHNTERIPCVWSVHEHDSLLKDLHDEQLGEEERQAAWSEYEAERTLISETQVAVGNSNILNNLLPPNNIQNSPNKVYPISIGMSKVTTLPHVFVPNDRIPSNSILPDLTNEWRGGNSNCASSSYYKSGINNTQQSSRNKRMPNWGSGVFTRFPKINAANNSQHMTKNAFKNVQIVNIISQNEKLHQKPRRHNVIKTKSNQSIAENIGEHSSSTIMDLTLLPDTPQKSESKKTRRRNSSGKKKRIGNFSKLTPSKVCLNSEAAYARVLPAKKLNFVTESVGQPKCNIVECSKGDQLLPNTTDNERSPDTVIELD